MLAQAVDAGERMKPQGKTDLIRIDVADASDDALIEQCLLERDMPAMQAMIQLICAQPLIQRVLADARKARTLSQAAFFFICVHPPELAGVMIAQLTPVFQFKDDVHMARRIRFLGLLQIKLALHAQMRDPPHITQIETKILADPRIVLDAPAAHQRAKCVCVALDDAIPAHADIADARMPHLCVQRIQHGLYFRKFRHALTYFASYHV